MSSELNKKINLAKCQHCGEVTDISMSDAVVKMRVQVSALKEELTEAEMRCRTIRRMKIGEVSVMHRVVKSLYDIMTPEQRKLAQEKSKVARDEIAAVKKKFS